MQDIISYLRDKILPEGTKAVQNLLIRASTYMLKGDILFKRWYTPFVQYINEDKTLYVMKEIYEIARGNHASGHYIAQKALK